MAKNVMPVILAFDKYYKKMTAEGEFESISCSASTSSTGYIDGYAHSLLDDTLGLFDQGYNSPDAQVITCGYDIVTYYGCCFCKW